MRCVALFLEERHVVGDELDELVEHALQQRLNVDGRRVQCGDLLLEGGDLLPAASAPAARSACCNAP